MKLTAAQAKKRILAGDIDGDHEVMESLDLVNTTIPAWPNWKFKGVFLRKARISKICGTFTHLNCNGSTLKEIDPLLQVRSSGLCADFSNCRLLKKAQGSFDGGTYWDNSGITEISPTAKFGKDNVGLSARFDQCEKLRKVQGNFTGATVWRHSGVEEINPDTVFGVDNDGDCAFFEDCHNLRSIHGNFPGFTDWTNSGVREIDVKTQFGANTAGNSAKFSNCVHLLTARGSFSGYSIWTSSGIRDVDKRTIFGINKSGISADFSKCISLSTVTHAVLPKGLVRGNITFLPKAPNLPNLEF